MLCSCILELSTVCVGHIAAVSSAMHTFNQCVTVTCLLLMPSVLPSLRATSRTRYLHQNATSNYMVYTQCCNYTRMLSTALQSGLAALHLTAAPHHVPVPSMSTHVLVNDVAAMATYKLLVSGDATAYLVLSRTMQAGCTVTRISPTI